MTNHPMLMDRDPAPILDVTRPAVPRGCHSISRAEVNELMDTLLPVSAAQAVPEAEDESGPSQAVEPAAADQFQPGDRVMCPVGPRVFSHYGPLASNGRIVAWVTLIRGENGGWRWWLIEEIRRPTAAELAKHWPDADGWIPWTGGECPVPEGSRVILKIRGGSDDGFETNVEGEAQDWWKHYGSAHDIIAYKVLI